MIRRLSLDLHLVLLLLLLLHILRVENEKKKKRRSFLRVMRYVWRRKIRSFREKKKKKLF